MHVCLHIMHCVQFRSGTLMLFGTFPHLYCETCFAAL